MRKILLIVAICLSFLSLNNDAFAVSLSLSPAATNAVPGDTVTLNLVISGLGNNAAPSLGDFDVDIIYDSSRLSLNGYGFSTLLGDILLGEALEMGSGDLGGVIDLALTSLLDSASLEALQPDTFVLATLEFLVGPLTPGMSTTVGIDTDYVLGDTEGDSLAADSLTNAVIYNRSAVVPEPTTFGLFALGIIGLVMGKKLRRN